MKILISSSATEYENHEAHKAALEETGFWGRQGAGCLILAKSTGRILVAHRSGAVQEPNTWGTWGGAIDIDEDPKSAVLRELKEESGYAGKVLSTDPLFVFKSGSFSYHNFLITVPEEFIPKLDWETQGYKWCASLRSIPRPRHAGLVALLNNSTALKSLVG